MENNPISQNIATLKATDNDIGNNGRVEYRLAIDVPELLFLDPDTGVLRLEKSLDREQYSEIDSQNSVVRKTDFFTVMAMAFDRGSPAKVGFVNITIQIKDVNDNSPMCMESIFKVFPF